MLSITRLLTLSAVISMLHPVSANADAQKIKYLAALEEEVIASSPDTTTVLEVNLDNSSRRVQKRPGPQHHSQDSFIAFMKEKYPASHRVFDKMPIQQQSQVYTNYQLHLDIDKSRKEMMALWRQSP